MLVHLANVRAQGLAYDCAVLSTDGAVFVSMALIFEQTRPLERNVILRHRNKDNTISLEQFPSRHWLFLRESLRFSYSRCRTNVDGYRLFPCQRGLIAYNDLFVEEISRLWPHRLAVRTPPSHGGNRGSIPLGATITTSNKIQ